MRERGAVFRQSLSDFPCTVELGGKVPAWGLSRWNGNGGLRFVPADDEGFSLRGDKRRLVYKGRKRSHRFTILGDNVFEYDCILEKEPESNVVSLEMEGGEKFDFFRQPDFVRDEFLKGSYAVYKKETLSGEGTGKLCHIRRPEITDARGRWCWGDLSVDENRLCITIPEKWLSEAAYPVVVDPVVGTATAGSQTHWHNEDGYYERFFIEVSLAANRFFLPQTLNGTATAYVYAYWNDYWGKCLPFIYSDNNNVPQWLRSINAEDFDIAAGGGKTEGWRAASFTPNVSMTSGSYVWFGLYCDWFAPLFDYGAKCYKSWNEDHEYGLPLSYPLWSADHFFDLKLSMYFEYALARNYVRVLAQGVDISDRRKLKGGYKRTAVQAAGANSALFRFEAFFRNFSEAARSTAAVKRHPLFMRKAACFVNAETVKREIRNVARKCADRAAADTGVKKTLGVIFVIKDLLKSIDTKNVLINAVRSVNDKAAAWDKRRYWRAFVRGLFDTAGNADETKREADYCRRRTDAVKTSEKASRGLALFVRIVTKVFIRDYLLRRFLVAREEVVLKSKIVREIK